jgi:hypothetical protein
VTLLAIVLLHERNPRRDACGNLLIVVNDENKSLRKGANSSWKTPSYRASISPKF